MNLKIGLISGFILFIFASFQSFGQERTFGPSRERQKAITDSILKADDNAVVYMVEKYPEFPGGIKEFYNYINKNMKYPEWEKENNIQGRVTATFVVEKDGSITNINILRTVTGSKNLNTETIRLLQNMPRWIPAKQGDKIVRCRYTVPLMFKL
ncbi:energy transducer TonB [Pseudopedobacter sp.]|uniref:energy transducer TonB n=1 Tax=Pseudopedobacter sp. TaxID=1936787 RepID=UPI00333F69A2